MAHDAPYKTRGALRSWTVRMNPVNPDSGELEQSGRSVWENSRLAKGTRVLLEVMELPDMAVSIGPNRDRLPNKPPASLNPVTMAPGEGLALWVNEGVTRVGAFPSSYAPLTVGCELFVTPSWQNQLISTVDPLPLPVDGDLSGVDVRILAGHELDRLQVWTSVTPGFNDLIVPRIWLRHPTGVWSEAQLPIGGPPPAVSSAVTRVDLLNSDRIYVSFQFTGPAPSGQPVRIAFGNLTAPVVDFLIADRRAHNKSQVIRFGAVILE